MATDPAMIGVLALQGNFAEHIALLHTMGENVLPVRTVADLQRCTHIILPGGESTTMSLLLDSTGLRKEIQARARTGTLMVMGVCAGAILAATTVTGNRAPAPLGLIDITIDRNAYGTQRDSFDASLLVSGIDRPVRASFIRAPIITRVGEGVEVLSMHQGHPVLVRSENVMALTCHPELRDEQAIHRMLLGG